MDEIKSIFSRKESLQAAKFLDPHGVTIVLNEIWTAMTNDSGWVKTK